MNLSFTAENLGLFFLAKVLFARLIFLLFRSTSKRKKREKKRKDKSLRDDERNSAKGEIIDPE